MAYEAEMTTPILIINFKCYPQALGQNAVELASYAQQASRESGICIYVCPSFLDLYRVASQIDIPVLAQHVDPVPEGSYTGHVTALGIKLCGGVGSLVNHAERRLKLSEIQRCIEMLRSHELISVACGDTKQTSAALASLNPDFIAIEPPELIGTGIPVSRAKPEIVSDAVDLIKSINPKVKVLCGAGITDSRDFRAALDLGTQGVLVSSGIVKARDPRKAISDLIRI